MSANAIVLSGVDCIHTIREQRWNKSERLAIAQSAIHGNIVRVDGCRRSRVDAEKGVANSRVSDVCLLAIRGHGNAIRVAKTISHNGDSASVEVVSVHLLSDAGVKPEILEVAVQRVGKVEIAVHRVDDEIIKRAELAAKVVVEQGY